MGESGQMKQIRYHEARLARLLQNSLAPRHPRPEFVYSLRERLARLTSMPVLVEQPRHVARSVGLGILGLIGAIASAFASGCDAFPFADDDAMFPQVVAAPRLAPRYRQDRSDYYSQLGMSLSSWVGPPGGLALKLHLG